MRCEEAECIGAESVLGGMEVEILDLNFFRSLYLVQISTFQFYNKKFL